MQLVKSPSHAMALSRLIQIPMELTRCGSGFLVTKAILNASDRTSVETRDRDRERERERDKTTYTKTSTPKGCEGSQGLYQ